MTNRELDALVAEKVMGWESQRTYWHPSTNISDAWQVVEKMRERGLAFTCSQAYADDRYTVTFSNEENGKIVGVYHEDTAPLAIAKAALEALNEP